MNGLFGVPDFQIPGMWTAMLLTVLIETPLMYFFGMRSRNEMVVVVCTNIATNLTMNLAMGAIGFFPVVAILLELSVVFVEYHIYLLASGILPRLFLKTLAANAASLLLGLLIMPPWQ
ncbi:MAG: hypothetical protein II499_02640 [Firmicutes bacterium]|nr:hypothetical protein [Bacillota bacterium]MBQ4181146.1 hypothetical protein [Bacillota bacterium]MBQ4233867.1 hypothetical protein [Bacillota bacterium]